MSNDAFPPALPHGPIIEVFPDVFVITGGFRFAPGLSITRNMTILRHEGALTLVNSVRLSPDGESALDKLGKVRHLVKIGAFHGLDDPWYVHRYAPAFWAPPKSRHAPGVAHDHDLVPGQSPLPDLKVLPFTRARRPEVALLLERQGGVLLTCDSYQNWTTFDGCSPLGKIMMKLMGFGPTLIGGPWAKQMGPDVRADFDALLGEPFVHLLSAHGTPLENAAKDGLRVAIARRYG